MLLLLLLLLLLLCQQQEQQQQTALEPHIQWMAEAEPQQEAGAGCCRRNRQKTGAAAAEVADVVKYNIYTAYEGMQYIVLQQRGGG